MNSRSRTRSEEPESPQWRRKHAADLQACGIPLEVVNSDRRWRYVLLHGDDELESGWNTQWITKDQAQNLLSLLELFIENPLAYDLLRCLRARASGGYCNPQNRDAQYGSG